MADPAAKVLDTNKQFRLPEQALLGLMDVESSLGRNMVNPESTARGPMQILEGTFAEINEEQFGGLLNWDDEEDVIIGSMAHFAKLYRRHKGDLDTVFARWYGHTDPEENRKFVAKVRKKMEKYGA